MPGTAVVFGGAGFVGSNICRRLGLDGWTVRAIDGLVPRSFADARLVEGVANVSFTQCTIETADRAAEYLDGCDLVVDAMGWTRHLDALKDPAYDLRLNVASHLPVIQAIGKAAKKPKQVVHLASRGQYGRPTAPVIDEDCPMAPVDVQGIHKVAAEAHWRLMSQSCPEISVMSLRFGNTYGPGQPLGEGDIGLIGGFIRAAMRKERIAVFGSGRRRNVLYAPDLAQVVAQLANMHLQPGFTPLNVSGVDTTIRELARAVIAACGGGILAEEPMPEHLARIEIGEATLDNARLRALIGYTRPTTLRDGLCETVANITQRSRST